MKREAKRVISRQVCIARICSRALSFLFFSPSRLIFPRLNMVAKGALKERLAPLRLLLAPFEGQDSIFPNARFVVNRVNARTTLLHFFPIDVLNDRL